MHCVVTSPPYWGLRAYGTDPQVWGGDEGCQHDWRDSFLSRGLSGGDGTASTLTKKSRETIISQHATQVVPKQQQSFCKHCNAWRGELGSEPTIELFLSNLVGVFADVRRVMRDDATLFVNLGDSYANDTKWGGESSSKNTHSNAGGYQGQRLKRNSNLKPGDLCNVPHRFAEAMRADGWLWRQTLVWAKGISGEIRRGSVMPESVSGTRWERCKVKTGRKPVEWGATPKGWDVGAGAHDSMGKGNYRKEGEREATVAVFEPCPGCKKCEANDGYVLRRGSGRNTTSHEYIFLFAKASGYFWDQEAVKEVAKYGRCGWTANAYGRQQEASPSDARSNKKGSHSNGNIPDEGGNPRSVLHWSPFAFPEAHFATFTPQLPTFTIKAGTSERGVCAKCGAPWARVVDTTPMEIKRSDRREHLGNGVPGQRTAASGTMTKPATSKTVGWRSTCTCGAETIPATVLDPFGGACTTIIAALSLDRRGIAIELNPEYAEMAEKRIKTRGKQGQPKQVKSVVGQKTLELSE